MKELIKWIKRNISVSIVALCVSIISAYFAYNRYMAENGSEIKPVVFNKIDDEKEKTFIFLTATDTETIVKPQIFRRFTNISKYTQKNVKVKYTLTTDLANQEFIETFIKIYINPIFELENTFHTPNHETEQIFSTHVGSLYQDDITPSLIDSLSYTYFSKHYYGRYFKWQPPQIAFSFTIKETIYYNLHSPETYTSKIIVYAIKNQEDWSKKALIAVKNNIKEIEEGKNCDIVLCYPSYYHDFNTQYYNINKNNIDSLIYIYDEKSINVNHNYGITIHKDNSYHIKAELVIAMIVFLMLVYMYIYYYRKINYITLTALLMPLFSLVISIVLSTYYYNNSDGIDIFMTVQLFTSLFGGMYLLGNIKYLKTIKEEEPTIYTISFYTYWIIILLTILYKLGSTK